MSNIETLNANDFNKRVMESGLLIETVIHIAGAIAGGPENLPDVLRDAIDCEEFVMSSLFGYDTAPGDGDDMNEQFIDFAKKNQKYGFLIRVAKPVEPGEFGFSTLWWFYGETYSEAVSLAIYRCSRT